MPFRLFFVSDLHGSNKCFRKFVNSWKTYKANALILGGDITGKIIVPIRRRQDGSYVCHFMEKENIARTEKELAALKDAIADTGYYPLMASEDDIKAMDSDNEKVKGRFRELMTQRVREWMMLSNDRLKGTGVKCYISPGNDDDFAIDSALTDEGMVINPEGRVVELESGNQMITLGYSNRTPWNSPRETTEEDLQSRIDKMASAVDDIKKCIFNVHLPPYDTPIDQAPKLNADLKPVLSGGNLVWIPAGSTAVLNSIKKYQPLAGLHGHIHESRGFVKVGRTICFNPGSEYTEGILRGLLLDLEGDKIKLHFFTSG
jgi:uncharacterized protein